MHDSIFLIVKFSLYASIKMTSFSTNSSTQVTIWFLVGMYHTSISTNFLKIMQFSAIYFTQRIKHFYYWRGDIFLRNCIIFMQHENVTYVSVNFVKQSQSRKKFADKTVTLPTHNENVSYISWDTQCWRTEDTSKSFALLPITITLHNNRKITMTKHHVISYVSRFYQRLKYEYKTRLT